MEDALRKILKQTVGEEAAKAALDEDLRELGLDSIAFIKMVLAIEETFGKEISFEHLLLDAMNTIQKILKVVQE